MIKNKQYDKINDKKVLHKVKKNWVVISLATFMFMGATFSLADQNVSASDNVDATNSTSIQNENSSKSNLNNSTNTNSPSKENAITNVDNQNKSTSEVQNGTSTTSDSIKNTDTTSEAPKSTAPASVAAKSDSTALAAVSDKQAATKIGAFNDNNKSNDNTAENKQSIILRSENVQQQANVSVNNQTKSYDDKTGIPSTYTVTVNEGLKTPDDWYFTGTNNTYYVNEKDIDTSAVDQSKVGTYVVTLNSNAISSLQSLNPNFSVTETDIKAGTLTIKKSKSTGFIYINGTSKKWDGNPETDPTSYEVNFSNGSQLKAPLDWSRNSDGTYTIPVSSGDLNVDISSQNIGRYVISLSTQGINKLQQINPNFEVNDTIESKGIFQITSNKIITLGSVSIPVNSVLPQTVPVTVNNRNYKVPGDWKIGYNNTGQQSIIYVVPVSYFDVSAINTRVEGVYTFSLSNKTVNDLNVQNGNQLANADSIDNGDANVFKGPVSSNVFSPSNFFVTVNGMKSQSAIGVNNHNKISMPTSLTLSAYMLNASTQKVFNNFTEFYVVPTGFLVASQGNNGVISPSTTPAETLKQQLISNLNRIGIKYNGLEVEQLQDYKGRQAFRIFYKSVESSNGSANSERGRFDLPIITDPNNTQINGSIGTDINKNGQDSSIMYVTDDPKYTKGAYTTGYSSDVNGTGAYINVPEISNAFGVKNAFALNGQYSGFVYSYQFSTPKVRDTFKLVGPDGVTSLQSSVTQIGNSGDVYNSSNIVPQTIKVAGKTYQIKAGTNLGYKIIPTPNNILNFGDTIDGNTYTIQYVQLVNDNLNGNKITLKNQSKVYDGTTPSEYQITLPSSLKAPTDWISLGNNTYSINTNIGDLDLSKISQNVGEYGFTLSEQGISKLASANVNYLFNYDLVNKGKLNVTKAPVSISGPNLLKIYDGNAYAGDVIAKITNKPQLGDNLNYTIDSISSYVNPGEYVINISLGDNPNYNVQNIAGKLVILAQSEVNKVINQTVNYVDENGNELAPIAADSVTFTRNATIDEVTGKVTYTPWTSDKSAFTEKKSPVVNGYYLKNQVQVTIPSKEVSVTSENDSVTVVYGKMGSLTPVDPAGNPIPGHDVPYPNDPKDPTKPQSPVIPDIPGMTPVDSNNNPLKPGDFYPIDPSKPGENVTIKYANTDQHINISYVDIDSNVTIHEDKFTGKPNDKLVYTTADEIKELEAKGYKLVTDDYPATGTSYSADNKAQNYTVTFKHQTLDITPANPGQPGQPIDENNPNGPKYPAGTDIDSLRKVVNQTVNYVDENGNELAPIAADSVTFTRNATIDEVTGKVTYTPWTSDKSAFTEKKSPVVNGYYLKNQAQVTVPSKEVSVTSENDSVTVVYGKMGSLTPVDPAGNPIPGHDVPYPNDPKDPTKPQSPIIPDIPGMTPVDSNNNPLKPGDFYQIDPSKPGENVTIKYVVNESKKNEEDSSQPNNRHSNGVIDNSTETKNSSQEKTKADNASANKSKLPQTGEVDLSGRNTILGLLALMVSGILGILGIYKKDQNDQN